MFYQNINPINERILIDLLFAFCLYSMFMSSGRFQVIPVFIILLALASGFVKAQQSLDSSLVRIFRSENLVGMSVVGVKGSSAVYTGSFGKRDISRNLDVNDSTMFRVASVSKTAVAAGIMKLHTAGLLNVNNDVNRYLNFSVRNPHFASDSITVKMLLSHTSSLQDGSGYDSFLSATASQNPPPDLVELVTEGDLFYSDDMFREEKPGSYFNYSNIEFGVLGTIIENVTRTRFDIWIRQNVLLPLHIKGSFNVQDISDINNVAVLYRYKDNEWVPQADNYRGVKPSPRDLANYKVGNNGLIFSPAGGLRISAKDLSSFLLMYLNAGSFEGKQIFDEGVCHLLMQMQWNYTGPSSGNNYNGLFRRWAMGLQVSTNAENGDIVFPGAGPMYGHCGDAYGLISDMWGDMLTKNGVVFITNGKQGPFVTATGSAFYSVEKDVFETIYQWIKE